MNSNFELEIKNDIDWRMSELSIVKTLPLKNFIISVHRSFLIKYSVPIIYSIWEGFVVNIFQSYVRELNKLNLNKHQIAKNILTHSVNCEDKINLNNIRNDFKKQIEFIENFISFTDSDIRINPKIPTKSNVNFSVINELLDRFNLKLLSEKEYKKPLDKLLFFRNSISHGDNSLPVKLENLEEFTLLINNLMCDICPIIIEGLEKKTYLRE